MVIKPGLFFEFVFVLLVKFSCQAQESAYRFKDTHLFVKVPRPKDSEGIFAVFKSSCYLLLLSV